MNIKSKSRMMERNNSPNYPICPMETPEGENIGICKSLNDNIIYNRTQCKYILESKVVDEYKLKNLKYYFDR